MKDKLVTPSYCFILAANFLLYFGFWLIVPVLPFYLSEEFSANNSTIGIILSCYTVAALCIRPFSGYLLDSFARKPLYLVAYFVFMCIFTGYIFASTLTVFIMFRIIHGISFGTVTVGGNTVVIDIMPSSRRGEGLGYYGLSNNIAMAVGPMSGLFLHDAGMSYTTIFCCALGSCIAGFCCATLVKAPYKPPVKRAPISLDRFILLKGLPAGFGLLMLSIPYGMTTNYVAMYAKQIGLDVSTGLFFTFMAAGMAISRIFSGKIVNGAINHSLCCQFLCPIGLCVHHPMESRYMYLHILRSGIDAGCRLRYHVSRLQHLICQSGSQQSARNCYLDLPHLVGCGYRHRYVDRRIHLGHQHFR